MSTTENSAWKALVAKYHKSSLRKGIWQISNSLIPFFLTWYLMYRSLSINYLITIILAFPAAGFTIRLFIIQHDCGHGSFFTSKKYNDFLGMFISILTLTPYHYWKKSHAIHHANTGKLEHRGIGEIFTMTTEEYSKQSRWGKFKYRLYRNPFILFIFAPSFVFIVLYRFPNYRIKALKPVRSSAYMTSLVIGLVALGISYLIGLKAFLMIQIPITFITSSAGMWLFYVQHQYEDAYWKSSENWEYTEAAMQGSSYYKLPKVLQWFTGNIGFHHIHHLSPRIPNYLLEKCHKENTAFQKGVVLTLRSSLRSILLNLWDENQKKLISFYQMKQLRKTFPMVSSTESKGL
jgi:omega-6 fatty acid desaturase (delta-12 desaturase)